MDPSAEVSTSTPGPGPFPTLSIESRQALRLAAIFWLAAALPYALGTAILAVAMLIAKSLTLGQLINFAPNLAEPNIVDAVGKVMFWWNHSGIVQRLFMAILALGALAWVGACWLLADAEHPTLRRTALGLRVVSTATLIIAVFHQLLASSSALWSVQPAWTAFVGALDIMLAFIVALHLRAVAALVADLPLSRVATAILWIVGLWLFGEVGGRVVHDRDASARFYLVQQLALMICGLLLAATIARVWLLMRRSLKPAVA